MRELTLVVTILSGGVYRRSSNITILCVFSVSVAAQMRGSERRLRKAEAPESWAGHGGPP